MIFPSLFRQALLLCVILTGVGGLTTAGLAQDAKKTTPNDQTFKAKLRATDAATLMADQTKIHLWGVENIDDAGTRFKMHARIALDNILGNNTAMCDVKKRREGRIYAQCINKDDLDLGLFMLQNGYVIANRADIYGTVFEQAYLQAEKNAQDWGAGIWGEPGNATDNSKGHLLLALSLVLLLGGIAAFTALSIFIMRGFKAVSLAQNRNVVMMSKERKLQEKERTIVAMMLGTELKANKTKIEAYLVIYKEMLKNLKDPGKTPKYKKTGDIVQRQPTLDRAVFDRNTDKLYILGSSLSRELVAFYSRIRSNPDYVNIEPSTPLEDVVKLVQTAVDEAEEMNKTAEHLIDLFNQTDLASA